MGFWPQPTQKEIKFVVENLKGNLKAHFFKKLENPLWFLPLKECGLLWYDVTHNDEDNSDSYSWFAMPYLIKITPEIPNDIYNFLQPLIEKTNNCMIENFWFVQLLVFSIAPKMPDEQFVAIISAFVSYVEQIKSIGWFNYKELQAVFERIKYLNPKLADKLAHGLLTVRLEKLGEHGALDVVSKYGANNDFRYNEILNLMKKIYENEPIKLFSILVQLISSDLYTGVSDKDKRRYEYSGYIHRPAIEEHEQNHQYSETEDNIISALRELAIKILTEDLKQVDNVLNMLENSNKILLNRIALHVLCNVDGLNEALVAKYLMKYEFFDECNYHHEYFHLIKNKFGMLLPEHQNEILSYIERGPLEEWYRKDEDKITAETKQKRWRFNKLVPILDQLTDEQKERFTSVIYDEEGKQLQIDEHPDFLTWMGHFTPVIHNSPIDIAEIKNKSITEIISIIQTWQPVKNNWINGASRPGLAKVIQEDIKLNPTKYIQELNSLQSISEPTYIRAIIRGLLDSGIKEDKDWISLIKFCETVLSHDERFEDREPFHDGDDSWYWAKQEVVSVFSSVFRQQNSLTGVDDAFLENVFKALKSIIEIQDENLEEKRTVDISDRLHTAINSLHGQAVEALLIYVLWLKNNDKPTDIVLPVLNKLVLETRYLESLTIIAHMLPWMDYAIHDWVINNIDNIFPTVPNGLDVLKVTWPAFILYTRQYNSMFKLLESKFHAVLTLNLWQTEEEKRIREHTAQHLAYYYGVGLYDLESKIISLIFDNPERQMEQIAFVNYIGFSLWDKDKKSFEIQKEVLQRFINFWERFIDRIQGCKLNYIKVLTEFERWYQCGRFTDNGWAINQLYALVTDDELKIKMSCFMLEDNLLKDLPFYPNLVFNIVSRLIIRGDRSDTFSRNNLLERVLEYIKDNDFPAYPTLKGEKDDFINKLLEQSEEWEVEQKTQQFSKYLERR